ncbi:MAG TPA: hypothetical protein VF503_08910 [Sphingobium sp.]|uniref:hypothetical protein n=1 Tax=Sphingobium sp. TaxID=1912891 RepID=UPI002ED25EA5
MADIVNAGLGFHMGEADQLSIWTITANTSDFPDRFVARRHVIDRDGHSATDDIRVAASLDEIRGMLPADLVCLGREPGDDPVIVESWI